MYAQLVVDGPTFSPSRAEQQCAISFNQKSEPGDIGRMGKYKNRPVPYGSGIFEFPLDSSAEPFKNSTFIDELRRLGASNVTIYINVEHGTQCNFELASQMLIALGRLDLPVGFSCYKREE